MVEFTCVVCGTKGLCLGGPYMKKFCSKKCAYIHQRMVRGYGVEQCKYNEGVSCMIQRCEKCGWNPVVEEQRKAALYEAYNGGEEHGKE